MRGLIPTGWYPTAVALDATGEQLFIASGYGFGSIAPTPRRGRAAAITDRVGVVSILDVPDRQELARFTKQVRDNNDVLPPSDDIELAQPITTEATAASGRPGRPRRPR